MVENVGFEPNLATVKIARFTIKLHSQHYYFGKGVNFKSRYIVEEMQVF